MATAASSRQATPSFAAAQLAVEALVAEVAPDPVSSEVRGGPSGWTSDPASEAEQAAAIMTNTRRVEARARHPYRAVIGPAAKVPTIVISLLLRRDCPNRTCSKLQSAREAPIRHQEANDNRIRQTLTRRGSLLTPNPPARGSPNPEPNLANMRSRKSASGLLLVQEPGGYMELGRRLR